MRSSSIIVTALGATILLAPGSARAQRDSSAAKADTAATAVHMRVIGVYDEESGEPLENVDIRDLLTGLSVRTTKTGTAPLFLDDTGGTVITLRKIGYRPVTLAVAATAADSAPLTTTLLRMGHSLPRVLVVGNRAVWLGKADTNSVLVRNGFYERRLTSAAPSTAFITGDKIQGTLLASNAHYFGRGICEGNVYIDGVHVAVPPRTGHFLNEGIDALVQPFDIAGIETYTTGELPTGAPHTDAGPGALDIGGTMAATAIANASGTLASSGCVSFIWLTQ